MAIRTKTSGTSFNQLLGGARAACIGVLALLAAAPALASQILLDQSPAVTGDRNVLSKQQGLATTVSFDADTLIDGIDIYATARYFLLGSAVAITIRADDGGRPGTLVGQFTTAISALDDSGSGDARTRRHADFAGVALQADTVYWVALASATQNAVQDPFAGLLATSARATGSSPAFRLYGVLAEPAAVAAIPEPGSLPLFGIAGIALLIGAMRRPRRQR